MSPSTPTAGAPRNSGTQPETPTPRDPEPHAAVVVWVVVRHGLAAFGRDGSRFHVTGLAHDETGFPTNDPVEIDRLNRRLNGKLERHR